MQAQPSRSQSHRSRRDQYNLAAIGATPGPRVNQRIEPALIEAKDAAASAVLATLPADGGKIELTPEQADAWLAALNDVRLALGTALDVSEDMPDELPPDDPRAAHLGVYHWLTFVQDALVQTRMQIR